jgi:hypothetical protein
VVDSWIDCGDSYQMSELHLCADVAGFEVAALRGEDFVHRGTVFQWHLEDAEILDLLESQGASESQHPQVQLHVRYRELEGLSFSLTAPHAAVIYNKPREIRVKSRDKLWFADIWRRNGWNGQDPVARIEMRYDRTALRELECESDAERCELPCRVCAACRGCRSGIHADRGPTHQVAGKSINRQAIGSAHPIIEVRRVMPRRMRYRIADSVARTER